MKHKYIENYNSECAVINMLGRIGNSIDEDGEVLWGIDGSCFASEINWINELENPPKKIEVRINSYGGSVFEGYSIISAIINSKIPVETYISGMAYSIAGIIAMCGKRVKMSDFGSVMIHGVSGIENDDKFLNVVTDTLITVINARLPKVSVEEIKKWMSEDTYFNATQAKEIGLVDEVVSTGKKIRDTKNMSPKKAYLVYNELLTKPNNKMKEQLSNILKLEAGTSDDVFVENVKNNITTIANQAIEIEDLKGKLSLAETALNSYKLKESEELTAKATNLIENAIENGKLAAENADKLAEVKAKFIGMAEQDFEGTQIILNAIPTIKNAGNGNIINAVVAAKTSSADNIGEDGKELTYEEMSIKDPSRLANIRVENPELFEKMFNQQYKNK